MASGGHLVSSATQFVEQPRADLAVHLETARHHQYHDGDRYGPRTAVTLMARTRGGRPSVFAFSVLKVGMRVGPSGASSHCGRVWNPFRQCWWVVTAAISTLPVAVRSKKRIQPGSAFYQDPAGSRNKPVSLVPPMGGICWRRRLGSW